MGVTSCGKTTVGEGLAKALHCDFIEGDQLHPASNIAKMSAGMALDDEDRWPWLETVGKVMKARRDAGHGVIASCSALRKIYRHKLAEAAETPIKFVHLYGTRDLLAARIASRKGHFMPASLLDSQLRTLEVPETDEDAVHLDVALAPDELVLRAKKYLLGE
jgi:gluconokinase